MTADATFVQEHISHGDYTNTRYVSTDLSRASVAEMLNSSPHRGSDEYAENSPAVIRVWQELVETGRSELGWADYRVLGSEHRPILIAEGLL